MRRSTEELVGEEPRLISTIRRSVVGVDEAIEGPFGPRRLTYADYTASGRSLSFIEDFIRREVMPLYANTHTETSATGQQTTHFREEAREIIKRAVGGNDEDVVIFCGTGATGAIEKLIAILNLRIPADLDDRYRLKQQIPPEQRPVVFIGPYEHHSNQLTWRESIADVVEIDEAADGRIDQQQLAHALESHAGRPLKIGSFSAASNVTGIYSDTAALTKLLHEHGALALFDMAAAGPYVELKMNPRDDEPAAAKDAIFLSPHKFVGGPGTPGVLVVKKRLVKNRVPTVPGGGTVAYVSSQEHRFVDDPVVREEGGTPEILGAVRAGLVFQLKAAVGEGWIEGREQQLVRRAIAAWENNPGLRILGNRAARRLSIVSFVVRWPEVGGPAAASTGAGDERVLHHNFVVTLLSDLFGIQARGGCSCAGPYGHRLLNISIERSRAFEKLILQGHEGVKPGWVRVNFNYFFSATTVRFMIDAVDFVATQGWKLLPLYRFDLATSMWHHRRARPRRPMRLGDVSYANGHMEYSSRHLTEPEAALSAYLDEAAQEVERVTAEADTLDLSADAALPPEVEALRWFPLPQEALQRLRASR